MPYSADVSPELKKEIFDKIDQNKPDELKALLAVNKVKMDFLDENKITPLQHACYKGNKEIAQMLIDHVSLLIYFSDFMNQSKFHFHL